MIGARFLIVLALFQSIILSACAPQLEEYKDLNLEAINLVTSDDNFAQVLHGGKNKTPVSAMLEIGGKRISGRLSLSGQGSLTVLKKSFEFEITDDSTVLSSQSVKFSGQAQDMTFLRSLLGYRVYQALGLSPPQIQPVVLLSNGKLLGLYLMIERINADFYRRRGLRPERIYKAKILKANFDQRMIADPEYGLEATYGTFYPQEIMRMVQWANSPSSPENLKAADSAIELSNMARFFAANVFLLNCDGVNNNFYLYKVRGESRLYFSPWDWERAYDTDCSVGNLLSLSRFLPTLLSYPETKSRYINALSELSDTFSANQIKLFIDQDIRLIQKAYQADPFSRDRSLEAERVVLERIYDKWMRELSGHLREIR